MKKFKTLDEQILLLKSRGLIIPDEQYAKNYLLSNNYYNIINGYSKYFPRSGDNYTNKTTFDEVSRLYLFDKELKQEIFRALISVESHLKAIFAHRFAETYPSKPYAYLDTACYDSNKKLLVATTIYQLAKIINRYKQISDTSIYHYYNKYNDVPIWVLANYLDFGELRYMLTFSPTKLQNKVAKDFEDFIKQHINSSTLFSPEIMLSFIENINDVRNICAHNNRLIGYQCRRDSKYWQPLHKPYNIAASDSRRSVYTVFISTQCFLSRAEYASLHNTIRKLMNHHLERYLFSISPNTILATLGFPKDWYKTVGKL